MADTPTVKTKRKQNQPKHHANKTRVASKLRRKKIVKAISEGKTRKEAGIIAELSPKTAESQVSQILAEPKVVESFRQLLNKAVPDDYQTVKYREILDATKIISATIINSQGDGMADAHSMTKDFIDVPDYPTQLKANDSISKLKGYLVERQLGDINFNFSLLTDQQLQDLISGKLPKDI